MMKRVADDDEEGADDEKCDRLVLVLMATLILMIPLTRILNALKGAFLIHL